MKTTRMAWSVGIVIALLVTGIALWHPHHKALEQNETQLQRHGAGQLAKEVVHMNGMEPSAITRCVAAPPKIVYVAYSNLWITTSFRQLHQLNARYQDIRVAYTSEFSQAAARWYYSIFNNDENAYPMFSNGVWQAVEMGTRTPTDNIDFIRFAIEGSALNSNRSACPAIVIYSATNEIYRGVLCDGYRKYFVHQNDYHCGTNDTARMACTQALITPPTFNNITNFNALYAEVMRNRKPECFDSYIPLDPDVYPEQAQEWALHSPNQQLREAQQQAWCCATNSMAPDVLEEILKSWRTQPPADWNNEPEWQPIRRQKMKKLIAKKRAALRDSR